MSIQEYILQEGHENGKSMSGTAHKIAPNRVNRVDANIDRFHHVYILGTVLINWDYPHQGCAGATGRF